MTPRKTQNIAIDGTSRYTAQLRVGSRYFVNPGSDCWLRLQADNSTAITAAAANSFFLAKGEGIDLEPVTGADYVAVIEAGAAPAGSYLSVVEQEG
jgi:hypothetical protein